MNQKKYRKADSEKHRVCAAIFELEEFAATMEIESERKDLLKKAHGWVAWFGVTDIYNETKDAIPLDEEDDE